MRLVVVLTFLFLSSSLFSQINRYFVYFNQKGGADYPYSLERPEEFLTQKSLARRAKANISLDSTDLPVNPSFVSTIESNGIDVFFSSKWFNGVLVQTSEGRIDRLEALSFVDSVALVAEKKRLDYKKDEFAISEAFDPPNRIISLTSDIQLWMMNANKMHEDGFNGEGITIAVLDNGFKRVNTSAVFESLWINERVIGMRDFVENTGNVFQFGTHGASVLSVIGGNYMTDSTKFNGVAPKANFILCITEESGSENRIEEYNWLLGAEYADSLGVDIINSSLGYVDFDIPAHDYNYDDLDGETMISTQAANLAAKKGILVVNSAGNEGDRPEGKWRFLTAPADANDILSVASVDTDYSRSSFSSLGPTSDGRIKPDVAALGRGTTLFDLRGNIGFSNGTSFSAPLIAGFAAGIWQMNPDWTKDELIKAIEMSGHSANDPSNELGYGVPNYTYISNGRIVNIQKAFEEDIIVYPNPFNGNSLFLNISEGFGANLSLRLMDPKGTLLYEMEFLKDEIEETVELNLEPIQQGVYYLFLHNDNEKKVIKLINF